MRVAYVDTSCFVAVTMGEPGSAGLQRKLAGFDGLFSSNLLEAELTSAMARERVAADPDLLDSINWVMPDRPLRSEIARVLQAGYVRGADCWHLATAIYLAETPAAISFLSLDERQRTVARKLGFRE